MKASLVLPASTDEPILSKVTTTLSLDLTELAVEAALAVVDTPDTEITFTAAEWSGTSISWTYGGDLDPGLYEFVWRINGGPGNTPVRRAGLVRLTE